jgi:hypothetical protein
LSEHESVENERVGNRLVVQLHRLIVRIMFVSKHSDTEEMENEDDGSLVRGLVENLFVHVRQEQRSRLKIKFTVEERG